MSDVVGSLNFYDDFLNRPEWKQRAWFVVLPTLLLFFLFLLVSVPFADVGSRWRSHKGKQKRWWRTAA
jgi:hypothetical protein